MRLPFAPAREWTSEVDYVYPTIRAESRTARIRLAFDNPDLALKPNMYANVEIDAAPRRDIVHVPSQAVIRTAGQERVILALGDGHFRPAEVRTGLESAGRVEILEGVAAGEKIVISSQFLIDSEASMDASLLRMLGDRESGGDAPTQTLPRKQGRDEQDMEGMDHSGHDMQGMDRSAHDRETMDGGGESQ
jgi:Cu(I)/Ag(I) efflux system membrane fusion protein